jgi:hypothetical protein
MRDMAKVAMTSLKHAQDDEIKRGRTYRRATMGYSQNFSSAVKQRGQLLSLGTTMLCILTGSMCFGGIGACSSKLWGRMSLMVVKHMLHIYS